MNRLRKREEREDFFIFFISSLLSKIYENRTVVFIGAEGKVDSCNEGYAWIPKS